MLNDMEAVAISNVTTHNNENKNKIVISLGTVQRLKS